MTSQRSTPGHQIDPTHAAMTGAERHSTIETRMKFATSPEQVWTGLMFYEQIEERPPLHQRLFLPMPIGTEGSKSNVGDKVRCSYASGHLVKCITQVDLGRRYAFEVVEQNLAISGGLTLSGGSYALSVLSDGGTEVAVTTRYFSLRRPRWLWKPIEAAGCHIFHRHLLSAMRRKIESGPGSRVSA